jgi:hypothetical protein
MFALRSYSSQAWLEVLMPTYVVATRQEAQTGSLTAEDHVREVPGVWIKGGTDPNRITIEASEAAAGEIERRFGGVLLIEPELISDPKAGPLELRRSDSPR